MEFFRQECWNGVPFRSSGDLPDAEIEPMTPISPALQAILYQLSHGRILITQENVNFFMTLHFLITNKYHIKLIICYI